MTAEIDLAGPENDEVRTELVAVDEDGAKGVALPPAYEAEGVAPAK